MWLVCVITGGALLALPTAQVTLAWTHSVERVRWEEDYLAVERGLLPVAARVRGSGAGMEPGEEAVLRGGWWHWQPAQRPHEVLRLSRSDFGGDHELCWDGSCRSLAELAPVDGPAVSELRACSRSGSSAPAR